MSDGCRPSAVGPPLSERRPSAVGEMVCRDGAGRWCCPRAGQRARDRVASLFHKNGWKRPNYANYSLLALGMDFSPLLLPLCLFSYRRGNVAGISIQSRPEIVDNGVQFKLHRSEWRPIRFQTVEIIKFIFSIFEWRRRLGPVSLDFARICGLVRRAPWMGVGRLAVGLVT